MTKFADDPVVLDALNVLLARRNGRASYKAAAFEDSEPLLARLVERFQSRPSTVRERHPVFLPTRLESLGEPLDVMYRSDKKDPADPVGEGRQGVWKLFRHQHDEGVGLRVYAAGSWPGYARDNEVLDIVWPEHAGFLGYLYNVRIRAPGGQIRTFTPPERTWRLFVLPGARALMATTANARQALVWCGGNLTVTHRGIEG